MVRSLLHHVKRSITTLGMDEEWYLIALGAVIGVLTAGGAVLFIWALHWLEEWTARAQGELPVWLLPAYPMLGALATGVLVYYFASAARGHGVPQVMDAIIRRGGRIPTKVGVVKTLASIFTVGSGGSAGAEGPIVQIGATVGSSIGKRVRVPRRHLSTLVGCGAAAGIASVFNAPIAGVFFVLEILLRDFSMRTFAPIVIAAVLSAATTQSIVGENRALFEFIAADYQFTLIEIPGYILLGIVCAALAVAFSRLLHAGENVFDRVRLHPVLKPASGALLLGIIGIVFVLLSGLAGPSPDLPAFYGNGYGTILWLINPEAYIGSGAIEQAGRGAVPIVLWLLILLVAFKAVGTMFTLASGGSGGVFAPSLFIGAAAGAAFGVGMERAGLMPTGGSPAAYALVGMAGVVAGTAFAPLTAILIILELTREPRVLLPVMLTAMIATVAARLWMRDSIYTAKLRQAGVLIGTGRDLTVLRKIPVTAVPLTGLPDEPIYAADPLSKLITLHAEHNVPDFAVVDQDGAYLGMVTGSDIRTALIDREAIPLLLVAELLRSDIPTVTAEESLDSVMDKFARQELASLCLVDGANKPVGLITRSSLMKTYQKALEES